MKTSNLNPEKSIDLINQVIEEAKNRFEENGYAFILWGATVAICCFTQYYMISINMGNYSWYPYLIMPLLTVYTIFYYGKKERYKKNHLHLVSSRLWLFTGINIMVTGFAFAPYLKNYLSFVILLLLGVATAVAGSFIKSRILLICGLTLNLAAYLTFFVPWKEHPLLMGIASLVAFLIPGIYLHYNSRKKDV